MAAPGARRLTLAALASAAAFALAATPADAAQPPIPISELFTNPNAPIFEGEEAVPDPVYAPEVPQHPKMAANGQSNLHDDGYMSDTYTSAGPLGRAMRTRTSFLEGVCASITFDKRGRLVTVCVGLEGPKLVLVDPRSLDTIGVMSLPPRMSAGGNLFQDFAGGGYFYLDESDRVVVPTTTRHIMVVAVRGDGFVTERDYDVSGQLASGDKIVSALPDWSGRIWFVTGQGVVGAVDPASGTAQVHRTGEPITNSFSVDEDGGVYIVTDGALYRFDADQAGAPQVTWREPYENTGEGKPGQVGPGSGTTPTVMGRDLVSITDNADPINVVAYKRGRSVKGARRVCSEPVFPKGRGSTDQSLIGTHKSMIVENNYGYTGPASTFQGGVTEPGLARVDVRADRKGCKTIWTSDEIAPSVVPKLSLRTGLVYTYTKNRDDADPWYLTALDFRTGKTVFRQLAGQGLGLNNNYAPITIGPDGSVYVGVIGGMVTLRDRSDPNDVEPRLPRLGLKLKRARGAGALRARLSGDDRGLVKSVDYRIRGRGVAKRSKRSPFRRSIRERGLRGSRRYRVTASVKLRDGRTVFHKRSFRTR